MSKKIKVNVSVGDVAEAIHNASPDINYYLDIETGEILWLTDEGLVEEEEGIREAIEAGLGERYYYIPYVYSHEGYQDMEEFIETVEDDNLKEKLYIAINGSVAFRRFKDVLLSYIEERERWFKFSFNKSRERAVDWLEERGIEATRSEDE